MTDKEKLPRYSCLKRLNAAERELIEPTHELIPFENLNIQICISIHTKILAGNREKGLYTLSKNRKYSIFKLKGKLLSGKVSLNDFKELRDSINSILNPYIKDSILIEEIDLNKPTEGKDE